jgi:hypothetical protein
MAHRSKDGRCHYEAGPVGTAPRKVADLNRNLSDATISTWLIILQKTRNMFSRPPASWPEERMLARRVGAVREISEKLAAARAAFDGAQERYNDMARRLGRPVSIWPARRYIVALALISALAAMAVIMLGAPRVSAVAAIAEGAVALGAAHLAGRLLRQWHVRLSFAGRTLVRVTGLAALLVAVGLAASAFDAPLASLVAAGAALAIAGLAWWAHEPDPAYATAELQRARAAALLCEAEARYEEGVAAARMAFERLLAAAAMRSGFAGHIPDQDDGGDVDINDAA